MYPTLLSYIVSSLLLPGLRYLHLVYSRVPSLCMVSWCHWLSLQAMVENRVYFRLIQWVVVAWRAGLRVKIAEAARLGLNLKVPNIEHCREISPRIWVALEA